MFEMAFSRKQNAGIFFCHERKDAKEKNELDLRTESVRNNEKLLDEIIAFRYVAVFKKSFLPHLFGGVVAENEKCLTFLL